MKEIKGYYLLAASRKAARTYCHLNGIRYDHRKVIDSPDILRGTRGVVVRAIKGCSCRTDWETMKDMLIDRECILDPRRIEPPDSKCNARPGVSWSLEPHESGKFLDLIEKDIDSGNVSKVPGSVFERIETIKTKACMKRN